MIIALLNTPFKSFGNKKPVARKIADSANTAALSVRKIIMLLTSNNLTIRHI